jgi:hypothetical protein
VWESLKEAEKVKAMDMEVWLYAGRNKWDEMNAAANAKKNKKLGKEE